ncbi:MAG: hypothetical protein AAGI22_15420 [Planctomycetota bacterium]
MGLKSFFRRMTSATRGPVTEIDRDAWKKDAQEGEFDFHLKDRWRGTDDFMAQSVALFDHFGLDRQGYRGKVVIDLGAGSKLRSKAFEGAELIVIEPLASRFMAEVEHCDLGEAAEVHSVPAEDLVESCVGRADLLVSINVLDHCFDFATIVGNVRQYLNEDGVAFLSFDKHEEADEMHPLELTEEICSRIFAEQGLAIERATQGCGDALRGAQTYGHGPYTLNYWLRRAP